jgi:hypothetical protein
MFGLPGMMCLLDGSHQVNTNLIGKAQSTEELQNAVKKTKYSDNFTIEVYGLVYYRCFFAVA